jgi:NAD(P)-dependent dehydrogenase (short-subunit alcohol dehydrogenase family)
MKDILKGFNLDKKTILITGSTGKIGSVVTHALSQTGAKLIITDINKSKLSNLKKKILNKKKFKSKVCYDFACDLSLRNERKNLLNFFLKKRIKLDCIINIAALTNEEDKFKKTIPNLSEWDKIFEVNLTSIYDIIISSSKFFNKKRVGSIINIGSIYGSKAPRFEIYKNTKVTNSAAYSSSKGALIQLSIWFSSFLAPKIRVNCISPGGILRKQNRSFVKKYVAKTLLKRMAKEEDIVGAVLFLCSDMSNYITGQNIIVDGGWGT